MRRPPRVASAILKYFGSGDPVLTGDLLEGYRNGRSSVWYWWQVVGAVAAARPFAMARGVVVGWSALWACDFLTRPLRSQFAESSLDWLIVTLGSHPFVMLWAVVLSTRPFEIAGYLASGWVVGRLHPSSRWPATGAFMVTVLVRSMRTTAARLSLHRNAYDQVAFEGWILAFAALPLLICLGAVFSGRQASERAK